MSRRGAWIAAIAVACMSSCKASDDGAPQVGSNSNWLRGCDAPVDCSSADIPECACGVCTVECGSDQDCAGIDDARCAFEETAAARSACGAAQSMSIGICLPRCEPGSCGEGQACVNDACVLAALPDNAFCNALPASTEALRVLEDELLALAEARRTADDLACEGQPMSAPQRALRLSPSLSCAARVLAAGVAETRDTSLTDSEGRGTQERVELAGYEPLLWADTFAIEATSPEHALRLITQDLFACMALSDMDYVDIGIGVAGDVYVMTLGAPR